MHARQLPVEQMISIEEEAEDSEHDPEEVHYKLSINNWSIQNII